MNWWYAENGQQLGPFTDQAFQELVRTGKVVAGTLVWHSGLPGWMPYAEAAPFLAPPPAVAEETRFCSQCGRPYPASQLSGNVCAACRGAVVPEMPVVPRPSGLVYGGFWIRFLARLLDSLILSAAGFFLSAVLRFEPFFWFPAAFAYETILTVTHGGTLGKLALGLQVVTPQGARISYGRSAGRYFAQWVSALTLFIGYIIAAFDTEKRALHDIICDTRVIRRGM